MFSSIEYIVSSSSISIALIIWIRYIIDWNITKTQSSAISDTPHYNHPTFIFILLFFIGLLFFKSAHLWGYDSAAYPYHSEIQRKKFCYLSLSKGKVAHSNILQLFVFGILLNLYFSLFRGWCSFFVYTMIQNINL